MEIHFATTKLQKLCNSASRLRGEMGVNCAKKVMRRLEQLAAADCLEDVRTLPSVRCHELTGDRKGQLAVDLEHPQRLIFKPDHHPRPTKADGGLDWLQVTRVFVVEIGDYH